MTMCKVVLSLLYAILLGILSGFVYRIGGFELCNLTLLIIIIVTITLWSDN